MAKKKNAEALETVQEAATETLQPPKKRAGRPKGSKNKPKDSDAPRKRAGRPKGSKNKPKNTGMPSAAPKRRGRPKGSGKNSVDGSFRGMVQQMIRDEVLKALKEVFSGI